jgi:prepilin-type N-terminal cleavage/methylation domain-containing protein
VIQAIHGRLAARQGENKQSGFTLIELMVVVMIIAILVGIAIPAFLGARRRAQDTASKSNLRNGLGTAQTIFTDNQAYLATAAMVTALGGEEPSLTFVENDELSTSAKTISVLTSGATLDTIVLASRSGSGTCYFLRHVATAGSPGLSGSYINSASGDCSADEAPDPGVTWTAL